MQAINFNIVIEKIKDKPRTIAGLEITEKLDSDNRYLRAKIISVGEQVPVLKQEDIIHYDKHAGHGITHGGKLYHLINFGDVVIVETTDDAE